MIRIGEDFMCKGVKLKRTFWIPTLLFAAVFVFGTGSVGLVRAETVNSADKATAEADNAKIQAQKALVEAEKAIQDAEKAIFEAEKVKGKAKEDKAKAMQEMVHAGHFPQDFSMTVPGSTVTAVFSHQKHTEREKLNCVECHPKVFIMKVGKDVIKKGHLNMEDMKKGKYCGNCHNGEKAFSVTSINHCKKCHPKQ